MLSLASNLTKNDVEFLPVKISPKKVFVNNMDFWTIKIILKKVSENNVDFSTREITSKKVGGNNVDFSTIKLHRKKYVKQRGFFDHRNYAEKVRGNDVDFSISENTSKKYVEMTWKSVDIWSSMYRRNIQVESTSIRHGVSFGWCLSV